MTRVQQLQQLYTETEAAEYLRISPATLRTWRCRGGGPMVLKLGRNVRYELASLLRFVESPNIPTQKKTAAS